MDRRIVKYGLRFLRIFVLYVIVIFLLETFLFPTKTNPIALIIKGLVLSAILTLAFWSSEKYTNSVKKQ